MPFCFDRQMPFLFCLSDKKKYVKIVEKSEIYINFLNKKSRKSIKEQREIKNEWKRKRKRKS